MDKEREKYLAATAKELRKTALTMIYHAKSGHPGGSFFCSGHNSCTIF